MSNRHDRLRCKALRAAGQEKRGSGGYGTLDLLYLAALTALVFHTMVYGIWDHSEAWRAACNKDHECDGFLRSAWPKSVSSMQLDLADDQWREFCAHLPLLCGGMLAHAGLGSLLCRKRGQTDSLGSGVLRLRFSLCFSVAFLGLLHGLHAAFPLVLACGSYYIGAHFAGTALCIPLTWAYALLLLCIKHKHSHVTFSAVMGQYGSKLDLDHFQGMHPWHACCL